ncbi:hypothetical protein [Paenibacillus cremeus]|uniref:Uncharacterized protein n=1 Tax=Paenibacillus cremeus TaxID=2163881 RepID=A0A559K7I9_9BACL|nr:hypothetical protein [Paenibacillus cremeus]TVY08101.1 hypothetical protein FPZ49_20315 [Paenibacillus cremeus]
MQEQLSQPFASSWTAARSYKDFDTQAYDVQVVSLVKKVPMLSESDGCTGHQFGPGGIAEVAGAGSRHNSRI